MKIGQLYYELITESVACHPINITKEMADEVNQYDTDEQLLRSGGISTDTLDRAAFGFADIDVKKLMPDQLHIKWKEDWLGVKHEQERSGLSEKNWAKKIDLSEPIDVVYEKGKFYIDDGHHRTYAAKILNKPLKVNLEIKDNPMLILGSGLSYDNFHRCVFKQVKNQA